MAAPTYDFTDDEAIEQGTTWTRRITWKDSDGLPVDLSGYTARMQFRASITAQQILVEFTTENGGITLGGEAGTIDFSASAQDTAAWTFPGGVYDLEMVSPGGIVTRLLSGQFRISPEVTR